MTNYKAIGGSSIGLAIIVLIISLNYEVTSDTHYCSNEPEKLMDCFGISTGLHTRCYLNEAKTTYDYCKGGWVRALDYIEEVYNIQECETKFWNTSIKIYKDYVKNYTTNCAPENISCVEKIIYYNSRYFDRVEITQHNETSCMDIGKVNLSGDIIEYSNAFCRVHNEEIHCDLTKDSSGGGADSNHDGICQSGEDDCEIMKINIDSSIETIKESRHELETK